MRTLHDDPRASLSKSVIECLSLLSACSKARPRSALSRHSGGPAHQDLADTVLLLAEHLLSSHGCCSRSVLGAFSRFLPPLPHRVQLFHPAWPFLGLAWEHSCRAHRWQDMPPWAGGRGGMPSYGVEVGEGHAALS